MYRFVEAGPDAPALESGPRTQPKPAIRCRGRGRPGFQTIGQSASAPGDYAYGFLFTHRNHGRTLSKPPRQRQRLNSGHAQSGIRDRCPAPRAMASARSDRPLRRPRHPPSMETMTRRIPWPVAMLLGLFLVLTVQAQTLLVVPRGDLWRWAKGTAEASTPDTSAWRGATFNDGAWSVGRLPVFYGEALTGTELTDMQNRYSSVFLRRTFTGRCAPPVAAREGR
jgi:hypothetical protein